MKRNKLISGLLAGALMLSSVVMPAKVQAETVDLESGLVASYSFDQENLSDSTGGADARAVVTWKDAATDEYTGAVTYVDDRNGGKAVQLGDYGLKLNRQNLGENFTVSLWLKPDGAFLKDQSCLFLGYHDPEKWLAVAGNEDGTARFWANGNGYRWNSFGANMAISSTDWHQLTLVGSADGMAAYLDGVQWGSTSTNSPLVGENQDIYVGVTYWDAEFNGLVDDVKVYNRALSEAEIYRLYDAETAASQLLDDTGVTVSPATLNMVIDRTQQLALSMHPVVEAAEPNITFESNNEDVATVTQDGTVTAVGTGDAAITVSVTLDNVTEKAEAAVHVTGALESHLVASFDFEGNLSNSEGGTATAWARNLNAYGGQIEYADGHGGQAVRLGDYGLELNTGNIGTDYTVSFWMKNEAQLVENQVLALLGYHAPENWIALSGNRVGSVVKFWGNGGAFRTHTTLSTLTLPVMEWHQITITGTDGVVSLYRDGVLVSETTSNNPLAVQNANVYLGVNFWDALFEGLVDEVRVYNLAMTQEEVQEQALSEFQAAFAAQAEQALDAADLLAPGQHANAVSQNLTLPATAGGLDVTWASSNPSVISNDGTVHSPAENTEVILTATFQEGQLTYEKAFPFTVQAPDDARLAQLMAQAEAVNPAYLTEVSAARLEQAMNAAKVAQDYTAVENAISMLELALDYLQYRTEAVNPFAQIQDPATEISLESDEMFKLFSVPASIADFVTVTYESSSDAIAAYENGVVTPVANGKTIVTATVTAGYDDFSVEYSTAVEVTGFTEPVETYTVTVETDGNGTASAAPNAAAAGTVVTLTATANDGYHFKEWQATPSTVVVENNRFTMPAENVTVKAVFEKDEAVEIPVTGVTLNTGAATLTVGQRTLLLATVTPENATNQNVDWTSSNSAVATVDSNGTVKAVAAGKAVITVTTVDGGKTATCTVTVTERQDTQTPGGSSSGNETDTTTNPDGSTTTTVARPDGSTTATTQAPNGSSSVVNTAKDGQVEATVTVSQGAVKDAEDAVSLPMPEIPVTTNQDKAPTVTVNLPTKETVKVEIPVEDATAGTVAILVKDDGTEEVIKTSYATEDGVVVELSDGDTVKIVDSSKDFADVPGSFWGADAVDFATSHALFNGTSATSFSPNAAMTRGMIVTVLARLEGVDTTKGSTWYEAGRQWSMENGISDGTNMEGSLTREQLATMLYRYAGSPAVSGTITGFVDAASVSDWALDAMTWAVENGIITGSNGKLNPQNNATRAEVAAMLMRFIQQM